MKTLFAIRLCLAALLLQVAAVAADTPAYMMTRAVPPDCGTPTPEVRFLITDSDAILWFKIAGMKGGDVASSEYYSPDGQLYAPASGPWEPVVSAGEWCFDDAGSFLIAGDVPATLPGTWSVKVKVNGTLLFTTSFLIAGDDLPSGTCVSGPVDYVAFSLATKASRLADEVSIAGIKMCPTCELKTPLHGDFARKLEEARVEGLQVDACYDSFGTMNFLRMRE